MGRFRSTPLTEMRRACTKLHYFYYLVRGVVITICSRHSLLIVEGGRRFYTLFNSRRSFGLHLGFVHRCSGDLLFTIGAKKITPLHGLPIVTTRNAHGKVTIHAWTVVVVGRECVKANFAGLKLTKEKEGVNNE